MRTLFAAASVCMPLFACVADSDSDLVDDQVSTTESEINGSVFTPSPVHVAFAMSKSNGGGCTATVIDANHALSALHCNWQPGQAVFGYSSASGFDSSLAHTVTAVARRPGTQWSPTGTQDWTDSNGDFADIVVVTFSPPLTGFFFSAQLAWKFPAPGTAGVKVGAGAHDGVSNPSRKLLAVNDTQESSDDSGGGFHTGHVRVDPGDSGGPFYVNTFQVLGTLTGTVNDIVHARYTSVPHFIDWILGTIGFAWGGHPLQTGIRRSGFGIDIFSSSLKTCEYACTRDADCRAFNYNVASLSCQLLSSVVGTSSDATTISADLF
jgi:hypothetical protein